MSSNVIARMAVTLMKRVAIIADEAVPKAQYVAQIVAEDPGGPHLSCRSRSWTCMS